MFLKEVCFEKSRQEGQRYLLSINSKNLSSKNYHLTNVTVPFLKNDLSR
jgi:hypothetical protein